jgi:hypothetical protein
MVGMRGNLIDSPHPEEWSEESRIEVPEYVIDGMAESMEHSIRRRFVPAIHIPVRQDHFRVGVHGCQLFWEHCCRRI